MSLYVQNLALFHKHEPLCAKYIHTTQGFNVRAKISTLAPIFVWQFALRRSWRFDAIGWILLSNLLHLQNFTHTNMSLPNSAFLKGVGIFVIIIGMVEVSAC